MDWGLDGSKHEKSGPTFSSFNIVTAKIIKKLLWSELPDETCLIVFQNSTGVFCLWVNKRAK